MKNLIYYMVFLLAVVALFGSCSEPTTGEIDPTEKPVGTEVKDEKIEIPFDYVKQMKDQRSHLKCDSYTDEEVERLIADFEMKMENAKTIRGKVTAAGVFIAGMKYCIPYSFPIWLHTKPDVDPEYRYFGMFMRKGLFLRPISENGYTYKPWGCPYDSKPVRPHWPNLKNLGATVDNGFTCSQIVGWCLINAGINKYGNEVLYSKWADDLRVYPGSKEVSFKNGYKTIRPGDLIGFKGHIALVIGVEGKYIIFLSADGGSDAAWAGHGMRWHAFDRYNTDYDTFQYKFIIQMAGVYND
jgi:hypothetical protein